MDIVIIIYSRTGHTLSVAKKLKEKLSAAGHKAALVQIETAGPVNLSARSATSAELRTKPAIDAYEGLVFGCPVQGGVPAGPMLSYLEQVASLEGKRVACLATGFFPAKWGSSQTLVQMEKICKSKGAAVCGSGSVSWFSLSRKRQISAIVDSLSALF